MKKKIVIPCKLLPSISDLEKIEKRKEELESNGYVLTSATACLLTYELISD